MKKKILVPVVATMMMVSGLAGGTLAYLMDTTEEVKNTFTVGNVDLTLTETTTDYKMVPKTEISKDPKVTVKSGSEDCWVFVKVDESTNLDDFITYTIDSAWTELEDGVYYREYEGTAEADYTVLTANKVTVNDTVTKEMMDAIEDGTATNPTLTFKAYAVQKEGFDTAALAWAEANK